MESARQINLDFSVQEASALPVYRRLGLLNGLLIGLALGLGFWGIASWRSAGLPVEMLLVPLIAGIAILTVLGGLVGWISSRDGRSWVAALLWLILAVVALLLLGRLNFQGRTLAVWLADSRFWGREIYPDTLGGSMSGLLLGGFPVILILGALGVLQNYRLENIVSNLRLKDRLNGRAWLSLLLPLPLVIAAGWLSSNFMEDPAPAAARTIYTAIERARTYDGDLDVLARQEGLNYGAMEGIREHLAGDYTLGIAEVSPINGSTTVAADFDNGAWIYCRLIGDQLNFCFDASPPYVLGLHSLLTGEPLPDPCRGCLPQNADEWAAQLSQLGATLGPDPQVERVAQWGGHVLMRASSQDGHTAVDCWYEGITRINIAECLPVAVRE